MISAKLLLAYLLQTTDLSGQSADTVKIDPEQAYCLAENIFYESRNEDIRGQFAVASVTMNRVNDPRFPKTVCDVVRFSVPSRTTNSRVCAFSWYCENDRKGKSIPVINKDGSVNQRIVDQFHVASIIAIEVLSGSVEDTTGGATHFHNPFVSFPAWRKEFRHMVRIGNHDFYKMNK